jgi:hypothetical protein
MTPLAASPASFQPSKAAMTAGELSFPTPSSSISDHLPEFSLAPGYVHDHDRRAAWPAAPGRPAGIRLPPWAAKGGT